MTTSMNPTYLPQDPLTANTLPASPPAAVVPLQAFTPAAATGAEPVRKWDKAWRQSQHSLRACANTHYSALRVLWTCLLTWDTAVVVSSAALGIAFFDNHRSVRLSNSPPTASFSTRVENPDRGADGNDGAGSMGRS
jgi:hypothetical protein